MGKKPGRPKVNIIPIVDGKLNLGCGNKLIDGYQNIDCIQSDGIIYVDLEKGKLPYADESCVEIVAIHFFEHISNLIPLVNECLRVLKPRCKLFIKVPVLPHAEAFQDPTHVRYFTDRTWLYFVRGEFLYEDVGKNYGIKPFNSLYKQQTVGFELHTILEK